MKLLAVCGLLLLAALAVHAEVHLEEHFSPSWSSRWVRSESSKDGAESDVAKYDGVWKIEGVNESAALVAEVANKHYGISAPLSTPFKFTANKKLVVQYEVRFQTSMNCGGSYIKLLSATAGLDLAALTDKTPYTILFGPDKCGSDSHLRFIYRFLNPATGVYREVHANKVDNAYSLLFSDKRTHLLTLVINPDNTYVMKVDESTVANGNLAADVDFSPALQPPRTVADPDDKKPGDWVDDRTIVDPEDKKPGDWDESQPAEIEDETATMPSDWDERAPALIPDPQATKPEDWSDEEDGEWEAPLIENPKCETGCGPWVRPKIRNPLFKGKWHPRQIPNPAYKGEWKPQQIDNPDYFEETNPFPKLDSIGALALELWTITPGITFSNFIITDDESAAQHLAETLWRPKKIADDAANPSKGYFDVVQGWINEFLKAAEDTPYLYVLFTAIVGLPIIILVRCCVGGGDVVADAEGGERAEGAGNAGAGDAQGAAAAAEEVKEEKDKEEDEEEEEEEKEEAPATASAKGASAKDESASKTHAPTTTTTTTTAAAAPTSNSNSATTTTTTTATAAAAPPANTTTTTSTSTAAVPPAAAAKKASAPTTTTTTTSTTAPAAPSAPSHAVTSSVDPAAPALSVAEEVASAAKEEMEETSTGVVSPPVTRSRAAKKAAAAESASAASDAAESVATAEDAEEEAPVPTPKKTPAAKGRKLRASAD